MITAPVNKIIPFSSVDGFGNRTAVFLQGCNQNCLYCHNPETIHMCISCGACITTCPAGALSWENGREGDGKLTGRDGGRKVFYDFSKCCNCDTCLKTCSHGASPKIRMMSPNQVLEEIRPFFPFINGITTSGGECSLYLDFLEELYRLVKTEKGMEPKTTYMDTNGQIPLWDKPSLLEVTDKTMIDLKAGTEEDHIRLTGRGLAVPAENIRQMAAMGKLYEIRTVAVPGIVDNKKTVELGSSLIAAYPEVRYKLIRFRPYGVRTPYDKIIKEPSDEMMEELRQIAETVGVKEVVVT